MSTPKLNLSTLTEEQKKQISILHGLKVEEGYYEKKFLSFDAKCTFTVNLSMGVVTACNVGEQHVTTKFYDEVTVQDVTGTRSYSKHRYTDHTRHLTGTITLCRPDGTFDTDPLLKPDQVAVGDWIVYVGKNQTLRNDSFIEMHDVNLSKQTSNGNLTSNDSVGWVKERTTYTGIVIAALIANATDNIWIPLGELIRAPFSSYEILITEFDVLTILTAAVLAFLQDEFTTNNVLALALIPFSIVTVIMGFINSCRNVRRRRAMHRRIEEKIPTLMTKAGLEKLYDLFPNKIEEREVVMQESNAQS